jgi:hypothetical protein
MRVGQHLRNGDNTMRGKIKSKALLGAAFCAASVVGIGAGPVLAGESTGSGKGGPTEIPGETGAKANGNSPCRFSGLEDVPLEPGTVQNWGHTKKAEMLDGGANWVLSWGEGCNPNEGG